MEFIHKIIELLPFPRNVKNLLHYPPGHFYSPIPSLREIKQHGENKLGPPSDKLPGIDLNIEEQLMYFDKLKQFYHAIPFRPHKTPELRYYYENDRYSYSDAIILHCMIRFLKPKRIIEVGSGFSSFVTMDTNELFFDKAIKFTCIEPFPDTLRSLMKTPDEHHVTLVKKKLQDVDVDVFSVLTDKDILFIDSTHVAKTHSDVNYLFFEILPRLQRGVHIHIHDIMYPFEYPRQWIYEGKSWNESYMLRTFLQYNSAFKIVFFNTYLEQFYEEKFQTEMPLCLKNRGGSIWLVKK